MTSLSQDAQPTGLATESGQEESGASGSRNHDSELFPEDDVTVPEAIQQKRRAAEAEEETEEDGQGMAAKAATTRFDLFDTTQVKRLRPAQLWEENKFLAEIFGLPAQQQSQFADWSPEFLRKAAVQLEQEVEPKPERQKQARETDSVFQLIGRQKLVAAWESRAEAERLAAISKWKLIVLQNPGASSLGRQLLTLNEQPQLAAQVVDDTFESKRTKTISSRAGSILLFMRWLMASTLQDKRVLPLNEETVYFYTSWLKATKAPATRSRRFLEAVGFMIGTIGADGAKQVLESARCQGSSLAQFKNKGPTCKEMF